MRLQRASVRILARRLPDTRMQQVACASSRERSCGCTGRKGVANFSERQQVSVEQFEKRSSSIKTALPKSVPSTTEVLLLSHIAATRVSAWLMWGFMRRCSRRQACCVGAAMQVVTRVWSALSKIIGEWADPKLRSRSTICTKKDWQRSSFCGHQKTAFRPIHSGSVLSVWKMQ